MPSGRWGRRRWPNGQPEAGACFIGETRLRGSVTGAFEAVLRNLEVVDGKLARLEAIGEVEALDQHGLHSQAHLGIAVVAAQLALDGGLVVLELARDVEVLTCDP